MLGQLFANGGGTANVGLHCRDVWRRGRNRLAHDSIEYPHSSQYRRRRRAVRGDFENTRLSQHAASMVLGLQRDFAESNTTHIRDAIVGSQSTVEHCEIRIDKVSYAQIPLQQRVEKAMRFLNRRPHQEFLELRVKSLVRRGGFDVAQTQPLASKIFRKRFGFGMLQHAFHLRSKHTWLKQFAAASRVKQLLVRNCAPEKVGKT